MSAGVDMFVFNAVNTGADILVSVAWTTYQLLFAEKTLTWFDCKKVATRTDRS